jgi:hypothetical protein
MILLGNGSGSVENPDPGSSAFHTLDQISGQCCGSGMFILDPGSGSALKNVSIFNTKTDIKFSKRRSEMLISNPRSIFFFHPGSGSRGPKNTGSRIGIRNTGSGIGFFADPGSPTHISQKYDNSLSTRKKFVLYLFKKNNLQFCKICGYKEKR